MIEGIDVSSWQGSINWRKVKQAGVSFAYIKATEGATYVNPGFARDWQLSRECGIVRGAYHFLSPSSAVEQQVESFARTVGALEPGDLPPALDMEGDKWAPVPLAQRRQFLCRWLQEARAVLRAAPLVYIGYYFARDMLDTATIDGADLASHPLWVPNWNSVDRPLIPPPWQDWTIWQYTSKGAVDGIQGNVDRNRYNGASLQALTIPNAKPESTQA